MKQCMIFCCIALLVWACGGGVRSVPESDTSSASNTPSSGSTSNADEDARGIGKFTNVDVSPALNTPMADAGEKVYSVKCSACHKLTKEKLVGPGWEGVTQRHSAEWIMNFATNTDEMLNKDSKAQAMLEICLVRMPDQNLSDDEARSVYEFMRKNDGIK